MKKLLMAFATILLAVIAQSSCKKASVEPAGWFKQHRDFYYDLSTDTSEVPNYRLLSVSAGFSPDELFFDESVPDTSVTSWSILFDIFGNGLITPKDDGLYQESSGTCGFGPSLSSFQYLFIPSRPTQGQRVPQYGCAHTDKGTNVILNSDTTITVPAGTYHTFCVLHPNGDRSYWNRDVGIVMYEIWQHDEAFPFLRLGTLKLHRFN